MSRSPYRSPLRQEEVRPSPPPQPPPEAHHPPAARQLTNSFGKEVVLTKAFGFPLRSLSREADGPIPPPPISVLEDGGSPLSQLERSAERPAVANRMAAPAAPIEAKVRGGVGKGMRVESGFVERAGLSWAEIGLRVLEIVLCLISFSVMAADKTSGWAGDSFDRYEEFRYCISINIIAFAYSLFQACAEFHHRMKKRHIIEHPLSYYFDFFMDQVSDYFFLKNFNISC
ncbi:CASP-like protein [Platanthera zijinensis]|uniref:CASP-like protein n=1 Tax=Platanthera zijinensis TaxID=2320716 RepID=A0AAP0FY81_9ASPA